MPALGADGAAGVHRRLVERTLSRLEPLAPRLAYTGADEAEFRRWLGTSPPLTPQPEGDLGAKLLWALGAQPALVVGSDIPDISKDAVAKAEQQISDADLVLGPAEDGGFWLIAARTGDPRLFRGVDWGTATVFAQVRSNAQTLGWRVAEAALLSDLDRPEDLGRWPDLDPRR